MFSERKDENPQVQAREMVLQNGDLVQEILSHLSTPKVRVTCYNINKFFRQQAIQNLQKMTAESLFELCRNNLEKTKFIVNDPLLQLKFAPPNNHYLFKLGQYRSDIAKCILSTWTYKDDRISSPARFLTNDEREALDRLAYPPVWLNRFYNINPLHW